MSDLLPDVTASVASVPLAVPPRPDLWLVLASTGDGWTVPSSLRSGGGLYLSKDAALKAALGLPRMWLHRRIVYVPGESDMPGPLDQDRIARIIGSEREPTEGAAHKGVSVR